MTIRAELVAKTISFVTNNAKDRDDKEKFIPLTLSSINNAEKFSQEEFDEIMEGLKGTFTAEELANVSLDLTEDKEISEARKMLETIEDHPFLTIRNAALAGAVIGAAGSLFKTGLSVTSGVSAVVSAGLGYGAGIVAEKRLPKFDNQYLNLVSGLAMGSVIGAAGTLAGNVAAEMIKDRIVGNDDTGAAQEVHAETALDFA